MAIEQIGSILVKNKGTTSEQLDFCLNVQKSCKGNEKIGRILKYYNFTKSEDIARALAQQVGWRYFDKKYVINLPVIEKFGLDLFKDKVFLPVEISTGLAFVFAHPFDIQSTDLFSANGQPHAEFYVGNEDTIFGYLEFLNKQKEKIVITNTINRIKNNGFIGNEIIDYLDHLIDEAVMQGATDIHIEPEESISIIRFRIDGILYFKDSLSREFHNNLINVVFNKAEITVSDFFRFHDARFQHTYANHPIDIRVSCIPSITGPAVVLRLLDINKTLISIDKLGFHKTHFETIQAASRQPHGIIIITGPTGSGKTTTLYAILNQLKSISTKVITIEDPIEIRMPLVNQVQINEKQGVNFSQAARAFLRHDPNIILIGEIRDCDTAKEAMRASITGHRVLTTLHTNTAVDCIYRLHDLGIELTHIANSVLCVVSQRLIRKLCVSCKKKVMVKKEELPQVLRESVSEEEDKITIYNPSVCQNCQCGYSGRTVIAEVIYFTEEIKDMVSQGKLDALRHKLKEEGHISLQQDAARLVREGVTSIEEAQRVAG